MKFKDENGQGTIDQNTFKPMPNPESEKPKNAYELWRDYIDADGKMPNKGKTIEQFFESLKGKSAFDLWKEEQIKKAGNDPEKKAKAEQLTIDNFFESLKGQPTPPAPIPQPNPPQPNPPQPTNESKVVNSTKTCLLYTSPSPRDS